MTGFNSKRQASKSLLQQLLDALELDALEHPGTINNQIGWADKARELCDALSAALAQPAVAEPLTDEQISGAVARGWCHPRNKFKVMDPDIAIAIADEVSALIDAHGIKGSAA